MNFLAKLEKKIGRYALPNLALYLIVCYAFGYIIQLINPQFIHYLSLNPFYIMRGQVWRIISWILIPPGSSNIFFVAIMCLFYWSIGASLERTWGAFYFNVYIFGGILITVISSFVLAGVMCIGVDFDALSTTAVSSYFGLESNNPIGILAYIYEELYPVFRIAFSTEYINLSIFLAYALTYPDMQVLLMFIIPIKVKWLGIAYGALIIYDIIANIVNGTWFVSVAIVASLLNFGIFFLLTLKNKPHRSASQKKQSKAFFKATKNASQPGKQAVHMNHGGTYGGTTSFGNSGAAGADGNAISRHKCAICGRTELTSPDLEFRFCSKCEGRYEYCQYHLFTHEHVHKNQ